MHISRIVIRNFRNFRHLDLPIQNGVTCVVGENNTGKSNLIAALRLAIDANLSSFNRVLIEEDFSAGIKFNTPEQVLVSVEFKDFEKKPNEEGLVMGCLVNDTTARITYRFRPKRDVREAISRKEREPKDLTLEDYRWEIVGGGPIDPKDATWEQNFGKSVRFDELQEGYVVVMLEPLRDVEQRLRQSRSSPLGRLLTPADIPHAEQEELVKLLADANNKIATSKTIKGVGDDIQTAFADSAGKAFKMDVRLGMVAPSFSDVSRSLNVLLSNHAMKDFEPSRNGLGLNNVLYISMVLKYFERRVKEAKTAGQLLVIEEPEAHLHPQLQRVLYQALASTSAQTLVTTHSTHITSHAALGSVVVFTHDGSPATASTVPSKIASLSPQEIGDLERFLDATRATLLFARRVMLVEGPAELFLVPALIQSVMKVDLEREGITVIPIHGTHFKSYAKLFGPGGIEKRCAIVTDGDEQNESDDDPEDDDKDDSKAPDAVKAAEEPKKTRLELLEELKSERVGVFACATTFELEITHMHTIPMFVAACKELNRPRVAARLEKIAKELPIGRKLTDDEAKKLQQAKETVLRTAKVVGKARFAQVASKYSNLATSLPPYLVNAFKFLTQP